MLEVQQIWTAFEINSANWAVVDFCGSNMSKLMTFLRMFPRWCDYEVSADKLEGHRRGVGSNIGKLISININKAQFFF